jgi:putative addiction module component (TIGR02574 family)
MANLSLDELLRLSVPERIQLAEDLWDSIAAEPESLPLTKTQRAEIERRMAAHDRDPEAAIPWEEVRAQLRELFG